jgi:hypothetical protein
MDETVLGVPALEGDRSRQVFVVHGRNNSARDAMFSFLRALGLAPIEWSSARAMTGEASPYIGTILDAAFENARAVVVLLTPDEITYLRPDLAGSPDDPETQPAAQARPNVLFEAGMAMGRDASRTILVEIGTLRPFSDVMGRHVVRLTNDASRRNDLAQRLRTAGCPVDISGSDWLRAGDFTPLPIPGGGLPLGRRVPSSSPSRISLDARFHDRSRGDGRIEILNRGSEPVFDVDVKIPDMPGFWIDTDDLPVNRLPAGKSFMIATTRSMGAANDYFDVVITARTSDGAEVREEAFISVVS